MRLHRTVLVLAFMLTTSYACHCASGRSDSKDGLELPKPDETFRSEGGRLEVWSADSRALQEARVAADRITLEPRGLVLFKYSEAAHLAYVLEGQAKVGLSYPWEETAHVRTVKQGDVIAVPRGIGHWCYNDGDKRAVVFRVADTAHASELNDFEEFYLHGGYGRERGSVLHGFDEELLSQAWDVDRDVVRQIRESQKGTTIVKVSEDIHIRDSESTESTEAWTKFTYNIDEAEPDIDVRNGGSFSMVTEKSFPILNEIKLSAIRVKLDPEAMLAPSYACNMDGLLYVTGGSGRIQVAGSDERLLDAEVREGSLVVIPQFHPNILKASGSDGLEFTIIGNSEKPKFSFLAGKNAVYRNIPVDVLAAGNNVPIEVEQKIRDRRQNDLVIFPPRGREGIATKEAITKLSGLFFSRFEMKSPLDFKLQSQA